MTPPFPNRFCIPVGTNSCWVTVSPMAASNIRRKFVNSYEVGTAAPVTLPTVWISAEGGTCNEPYTGRRNHEGTRFGVGSVI